MQQSINLSPPDLGGRENHRNYVFVDEHNRHKRLKVMRACEGCRRRKIKCDAATTNSWPCAACVRLKLQCIPPMVQYDRDFAANQIVMEHEQNLEFGEPGGGGDDELAQHQASSAVRKASQSALSAYPPPDGHPAYRPLPPQEARHPASLPHSSAMPYASLPAGDTVESSLSGAMHFQAPPSVYQTPPAMRPQEQWSTESDYASALVGSLKIDDSGIANYMLAQGQRLADTPAYEPWSEELEHNPSYMGSHHEFAVKIRPEDMPSEDELAELFSIFFNHIHPYIPIVNKAAFYRQWNANRDSISPLLLETMFACAGRLSSDPTKGLKWIAMASRHVDCFLDVPRLSTVQALLLLLKARESAPQRGYFFRSWMSINQIIAMARELGLESHSEQHHRGAGCGDAQLECMTRTRVWQACFVYEVMICAPQGRDIMQCEPQSVDLSLPIRSQDLDDEEADIHRNFIHLVCLIRNVRRMNDVHAKLKAHPNWRSDPQFMNTGSSLDHWLYELPPSLHVDVSTDPSAPPPQPASHFAGNLQVYYHLTQILLNRPALAYGKTYATGGQWRKHMGICTTAAKTICRLVEVIFRDYGMLGLQVMLRGVNFTIYSLLTGAMIHLIAATCPDAEFNVDAKEYFTRTMRLLEDCIDSSASSEVKGQIETLREAFSVDVNRPFVLNPSIPFYHSVSAPVDPHLARSYSQADNMQSTMAASGQVNYTTHPLSPPHSTGESETKGESPAAVQSLVMLAAGQGAQAPTAPNMVEHVNWNPSRLFDNWNSAFAGVNGTGMSTPTHHQEGGLVDSLGGGHPNSSSSSIPFAFGVPHSFVSPGMWQDSVAAATGYSESGKRTFPFGNENMWSSSTSHERSGVLTPTTTPATGTALRATNRTSPRGH